MESKKNLEKEKEIREKTSSMAFNGKTNPREIYREREREREEQEQEQERLEIGRRKWIGMENHITRECNSNKSNKPKTKKIGERASERASARERRDEEEEEASERGEEESAASVRSHNVKALVKEATVVAY